CVLVNVGGYYDPLLRFLDSAVDGGFIRSENRGLVRVARDSAEALEMVEWAWGVRVEVAAHDARLDELVK
ncbi:MAG: LOG family protein, partial [Acidobacteriaceae bacterium]